MKKETICPLITPLSYTEWLLITAWIITGYWYHCLKRAQKIKLGTFTSNRNRCPVPVDESIHNRSCPSLFSATLVPVFPSTPLLRCLTVLRKVKWLTGEGGIGFNWQLLPKGIEFPQLFLHNSSFPIGRLRFTFAQSFPIKYFTCFRIKRRLSK